MLPVVFWVAGCLFKGFTVVMPSLIFFWKNEERQNFV
jgi:hypothetical protein